MLCTDAATAKPLLTEIQKRLLGSEFLLYLSCTLSRTSHAF